MIRIAIVGGIGSGKTYISNLFGYPVFNADEIVSKIYSSNIKIFYKLKKKLPKFFLTPPIKKEELIRAILKNKNNIKIISKIVHPEVRKELDKFLNQSRIVPRSFQEYNRNFVIPRSYVLQDGVMDLRNMTNQLQLVYNESTAPTVNKMLMCFML